MIEIIGILGGSFFAFAAVPSAIKAVWSNQPTGTPPSIIWSVLLGCILMYFYILTKFGFDWIVTFSYGIETLSWVVICVYHYKKIINILEK